MSAADDVLSRMYARFIRNWAFIISLRQVADVALPMSEKALAAIHLEFVEQMSVDPEYKKIIVKLDGRETTWDEKLKRLIQSGMTQGALANARAAIDAASLIFSHSVLDDCAWSYLRVCSLANPADWDSIIGEKKVSFADLVGQSPEGVREILIKGKLEQLERDPLLKKIDLLFGLCSPPKGFTPIGNYSYDPERLQRIDDARHGIVHRDGMGKPIGNVDDDLDFLSKTVNYLLALVNQKYGAQLDPVTMFNLGTPPGRGLTPPLTPVK